MAFSVSATTRPKREGEVHGVDYFFLSEADFKNKIANNEFIEWEEVYPGRFYGTLKSEVEKLWAAGKTAVFDVDVKGATNVKKMYKDDAYAIFVRPPSLAALMERLENRKTETAKTLATRMERAKYEMSFEENFDRILINDDLQVCLEEAERIVESMISKNKIIYNVTTKIDASIQEEWLHWMKTAHIPDVMKTGKFLESKISRLLDVDETDGITYAIQYICEDMDAFMDYNTHHAEPLRAEYREKYKGKYVIFRTMMQVIDEF